MFEKIELTMPSCDICGDYMYDDNGSLQLFADDSEAIASIEDTEWRIIDRKLYCPRCLSLLFDYDDFTDEYRYKDKKKMS